MSAQSASISGLPFRSSTGGSKDRRFGILAWSTGFGAIILILVAFALEPESLSRLGWDPLVWAVLAAAVGLVPVRSTRGPALAADLPLLLGAGFVFGPAVGGLIAFVGATDLKEVRRQLSLPVVVFNRAQTCLCVMAAAVTFRAVGGQIGTWPLAVGAALLGLLVDASLNYVFVAAGSALRLRVPIRAVLNDMKFGSTPTFAVSYVCLGFLGLVFAEVYARLGVWGLLASLAPTLLARQAFSHVKKLDVADRALANRGRALARLSQRIADERRDERSRIAAALHDDVLQSLYNVTIHAHVIREDLRGGHLLALDDDLPALLRASEGAADSLRDVIHDLRRSSLGRAGLENTLELLARDMNDQGPDRITVQIGRVEASPEVQLLIYQIAREALTNACKHSHAGIISLSLRQDENEICIRVEDDGQGFDISSVDSERHFGLMLMKERVESAGGLLLLDSEPGRGTRVAAFFGASSSQA